VKGKREREKSSLPFLALSSPQSGRETISGVLYTAQESCHPSHIPRGVILAVLESILFLHLISQRLIHDTSKDV